MRGRVGVPEKQRTTDSTYAGSIPDRPRCSLAGVSRRRHRPQSAPCQCGAYGITSGNGYVKQLIMRNWTDGHFELQFAVASIFRGVKRWEFKCRSRHGTQARHGLALIRRRWPISRTATPPRGSSASSWGAQKQLFRARHRISGSHSSLQTRRLTIEASDSAGAQRVRAGGCASARSFVDVRGIPGTEHLTFIRQEVGGVPPRPLNGQRRACVRSVASWPLARMVSHDP